MTIPALALAILLALATPSPQRKPLPCELPKVDPPGLLDGMRDYRYCEILLLHAAGAAGDRLRLQRDYSEQLPVYTYAANKPVYKLVDATAKPPRTYIMQSYSRTVDPTLAMSQLVCSFYLQVQIKTAN